MEIVYHSEEPTMLDRAGRTMSSLLANNPLGYVAKCIRNPDFPITGEIDEEPDSRFFGVIVYLGLSESDESDGKRHTPQSVATILLREGLFPATLRAGLAWRRQDPVHYELPESEKFLLMTGSIWKHPNVSAREYRYIDENTLRLLSDAGLRFVPGIIRRGYNQHQGSLEVISASLLDPWFPGQHYYLAFSRDPPP